MVTVRVPATTANIGPGFDTFGCAFRLYNTFKIEEQPSGLSFEGFDSVFCNEGNLVVVGYRAVMNALHLPKEIYNMMPYVASMIVLAFTSKKSRAPKAEGIPYDKGQR